MASYAEDIAAVRAERHARDAARDSLYLLQLRALELGRALAREKRGEGTRDLAAEAQLRSLARQLAAAQARGVELTRRYEESASARDAIERLERRLESAAPRIAAAASEISRLGAQLRDADLQHRARLQEAVNAAQAERAALRTAIEADQKALANAQATRANAAALAEQRQALEQRINGIQQAVEAAEHRARSVKLDAESQQNQADLDEARRLKASHDAAVRERIEALYAGQEPEELIAAWDDALPITLLPLRLETRWKTQLTAGSAELWVRVYPDDIAVVSHEAMLTEVEIERGQTYWNTYRTAAGEVERRGTWDALAKRFGGNRAAWVAKQTRPLNWEAAAQDPELELEFPAQTSKPDDWTTAAHSRVLPDRFVLMAWRGATRRIFQVGKPVDDLVFLGPSPVNTADEASLKRDDSDQSIAFGDSLAWVRNFDRAVQAGLGFRAPVSAEDLASGFDRLLVLGLKLSADAEDGQALLEQLFDSHHYSRAGFELLPQGTPTNNTDGNDSGYTRGGETGVAGAGPDRFSPTAERAAATDGQRLADFLGIGYSTLQHADGADRRDYAEAVAMNRALYAGTLGYYLDQMLSEVVAASARAPLRQHFTNHVTGRGPLAALRIGNQPYGILPTSSLALWQPRGKPGADGARAGASFEAGLLAVLRAFDQQYSAKLGDVAQLGASGNGSQNLLKVLGLHPTSAEFYQRVGYSYDYLRNLESFAWGGSDFDDVLRMALEGMAGRQLLYSLGYEPQRADASAKPTPALLQLIWRHYQTTLDPKQLIDGLPLSETTGIKPYSASSNYIDWLLANANNANALEAQDFGGAPKPAVLLFMLLQFASIMESGRAIHDFLLPFDIQADELVRSRKFLNVTGSSPSVWEVFRAPATQIAARAASSEPLLAVVHAPQLALGAGASLAEQKAALAELRGLPTARLERALVEHLDTLNYRLDAWQTSLFARRLHSQRGLDGKTDQRRLGAYLGAYGYLENVKPAGPKRARTAVEGENDLYREAGNGGYVHAASLNHATAAALLRNGYLTHASPDDPQALAVNLSSERVQRAQSLIEGIRNGQSLEALLGVQFERGLHDWTTRSPNPVILDDLKPVFRTQFPIVRTRVPQAASATEGASEVHEDYQVTNGLTLARTTTAFPWGIAELATRSIDQQNALKAEKAAIEDTLDALRDVLTAESAYQLALGNFDRAAAVLQSIGSGTLPPDLEVLNTPRGTQLAFTQRFTVQLGAAHVANPWSTIALTERARLEPALNAWLGDLLGAPGNIACRVAAVSTDGTVLTDGGGPIEDLVTLEQLALQPIDVVYLVRNQPDASGVAELETRVRHVFASARALSDDVIVRISFADCGPLPGARSFAEALPLADRLRKLLGAARPLDARHFSSASKDLAPPSDNPGRIDTVELQLRVSTRLGALGNLFGSLKTAADTARGSLNGANVDALRAALLAAARAGFGYAMPRSVVGNGVAQRDLLVAQADAIIARSAALQTTTTKQLADAAASTRAEEVVSLLAAAVKSWMGADTLLLPRFVYGDPAAVHDADAARTELLSFARTQGSPLPVEEWLHGVACVRERMHEFEVVRMMAEALRTDPLPLAPLQLPFRSGDCWLGARFPPNMQVVHDTVSMVQHLPQGFASAGLQCGLLIDEWSESIPNREEVTGLTFNFNAPNSAPPQAILLAVSPNETGSWSWNDLVDSVLDTFRRAKLRAVEPDSLGDLPGLGTLLPAVIAEFGTSAASVSLDYSMLVAELRAPLLALMTAKTGGT